MLRAYLFGGLELIWDEHSLPSPPGATARSLLAYLLTYHDRPHTRDLLAGTFWPHLPDATARRRLSHALWQIRRLWRQAAVWEGAGSPAPLLQTQGATVQIDPRLPLWLDTAEFARQHARCTAGAATMEAGVLAVDLYRGEFLAGHYEDWAVPERERLRGMLLEVLGRLLEGHKSAGDYERALAYARRLTAEDPWHEGAHREVMRLCHLAGRDSEALAQYESCRRVLAEEMDSAPSPETVAVAAEIAAQAGLPAPLLLPTTAREVRAPLLERPDQLPLVGRRAELAELVRQVEMAAAGNGGLTIVYGEAGVGKSRLLREVTGNAEWRGLGVAWGRCYELAVPPAYQPLVEVLRAQLPALQKTALSPLWRAELSRLQPELAPIVRPEISPSPGDQQRLLEAIASALLALAAAAPLLVLLEDAQWMDPASLEALHYLLPRLSDAPLLVLVSVRSEELAGRPAAALAAMEHTRLVRRLELGRLDQVETTELVRRALAIEQAAPRFSARLYAETEGNPFFLIETLWALVQEGLLYRDSAGLWSTPWDESTADYGELPLPAGVAQSIGRRLERLPSEQRNLLQLAAVIGREVDFSLWLAASSQDEGALLDSADALCASGLLLAAGPRRSGGVDYTFGHDLIRRVCYEHLAGPRRRAYHRQVAQALAHLAPEEPAALAYHWTQAAVWDQAARWHRLAGDRALAVYANTDAAAHYTHALEALEQLPSRPDLAGQFQLRLARESANALHGARAAQAEDLAALEALGEALDDGGQQTARWRGEVALHRARYATAIGDYAAAITAARAAIDLACRAGDQGQEAMACLHWGSALWHQGACEEAHIQLERALDLARHARLWPVVADSELRLGQIFLSQGSYAQARGHLTRASDLYQEAGDTRGQGEALENLGRLSRLQGDYRGAQPYFEQVLRVFSQVGDRQGESRALQCLGSAAIDRGDHAAAESYLERALRIASEIRDREAQSSLLSTLGVLDNRRCQYGRARAHFEQSLDICHEIGNRRGEVIALTNLGIVLYCLGDYGQAASCARQAWELGREIGDRRYEGWALHTLGRVGARQSDYAQARSHYEQGLEISRELGDRQLEAVLLWSLSLLAHDAGDDRLAQEYARQSWSIAQGIGELVDVGYALNSLARALAGLGELEEAGAACQQAVELRRRLGQHNLAMESQADLAEIALARGDLVQARACVEEILAHLEGGTLDGAEEPLRVLLTCYRVLHAMHDLRAERTLTTAHHMLLEQAARISSDELRRSFLEGVAVHGQIIAAYQELLAGQKAAEETGGRLTVSLPRADAPLGRPLRPDEFVTIAWTVQSPEDEEWSGKVARRRRRIVRLLAEAQAQGAAPRDEDLAAALEVSLSTLRRDVAALRARGYSLPTRGREK